MTSRLDRLFVLLESGSSAVTRKAAACQLGEVQRLHPHELHNLLGRILTYLHSQNWDTRIAAGQAVQAILSNVPEWDPPGAFKTEEGETSTSNSVFQTGRLTFEKFDVNQIMANSAHLLGSEGKEYNMDESLAGFDTKECLARQRQQVNAQLGLDTMAVLGVDTSDIVSEEDIACASSSTIKLESKKSISEMLTQRQGSNIADNIRIRRLSRVNSKQHSPSDNIGEPDNKRIKLEDGVAVSVKSEDTPPLLGESVPDGTGSWGDAMEWPFEFFCDQLCEDLFSSSWEIRHGAATALREFIKVHGPGGGKTANATKLEMETLHQQWLEDIALRLLCVLGLDRFGDFVSDQVTAPVRETCAQALGMVLQIMPSQSVHKALQVLLQLQKHQEWEARHGGLLGLKYLLAVREDLVRELLPLAYPHIVQGLADSVDDVGAVAASALIPVADTIVNLMGSEVDQTIQQLWDLLEEQDELAAACNSFMGLLAALLSVPQCQTLLRPQPLSVVVPRLWPFLAHSTSSVRCATLQTLFTLTGSQNIEWTQELLQEALRHVFQMVLLEPVREIQLLAEKVWNNLLRSAPLAQLLMAACPYVTTWLCLTMQPAKIAFDTNALIRCVKDKSSEKGSKKAKAFSSLESNSTGPVPKLYVGGGQSAPSSSHDPNVVQARILACRMLGYLSCFLVQKAPGVIYTPEMESPIECFSRVMLVHLNSKSALQRMIAGLVLMEWGKHSHSELNTGGLDVTKEEIPCPKNLGDCLNSCLNESIYYDEIAHAYTKLLHDAWDFVALLKHYKLSVPGYDGTKQVLTLEQIQQLAGQVTEKLLSQQKLKPKVVDTLEQSRKNIQKSVSQTIQDQSILHISTQAAIANSVVLLRCLPEKLHPLCKSIMESIKKEENDMLQMLSSECLAVLIEMATTRTPCPVEKIITNLCIFLRSDPEFTPQVKQSSDNNRASNSGAECSGGNSTVSRKVSNFCGIPTLVNQQKSAERAIYRRSNSTGRGPGRPPIHDLPPEDLFPVDEEAQKRNQIMRRGATYALKSITAHFGNDLPNKLPKLWEIITGQIRPKPETAPLDLSRDAGGDQAAKELIADLQVLEVVSDVLHRDLLPEVMNCLPQLCQLLMHTYSAVRHMAARCIGALAALASVPVMEQIVARVLPTLGAVHNDTYRQGAIEAIMCVIEKLQTNIIPFVVILIVPLLGRMSDQDQSVRLCATHSFATLIQLMPLDGGVPDPPDFSNDLSKHKQAEKQFLEQLFNPKTIDDFKVPVPINAQLRSYQQSGVNWLAFLNKYKLHGILCDDMGLGKTLQSICMLASDHYNRAVQYKKTGSLDCAPLQSLVICPPTLTGHWVYEIEKFLSKKYLNPLQYAGPPQERERLRNQLKSRSYNLIVASYDIVRKDIDFFSTIKWNYCILDEGQYIKNGKTKASKAIKQLVANHRLILSGTPIQNNVLELWSLFDFLMPGFLGTEKQFNAKYSRPILASREAKSSPKEQEAGVLAMEGLHRQVLPFLLRRVKEDVLHDLPPKITQDYYCELSPLQQRLYEDFARTQAHQSLAETIAHTDVAANALQANTHIFQALRYLQKVCNHPRLVLLPTHPEFEKISAELRLQNSDLQDIQHAAKLPALKQLLLDCGIGAEPSSTAAGQPGEIAINQHRALIFCQLKVMLDIVENDLLKKTMPGVSYLRLDGTVPATQRHAVVQRFNKDPSIDVLLLTTQVGGLGLNLTGADTVIFVEHDWNPMKDLQAMDRAHRIGQKKVVNVYRLITRATLEEKIMGLQKFKILTANTIISSENASMETMGTEQLLDLFSLENGNKMSNRASSQPVGHVSIHTMLNTLPDLWEDKQYEEEYDMKTFMKSLKKN
ncbi:TATA-binding protein-associated factor 172 [Frankliniella occidentalis]|uniref:TATA-binding protein-associated factor 172 n=1 Tax=Frankliniella occidentalis TaxID=133901 RepID=A0A6J1SS71_FRAOC|nr:TATA-binding protein-associated factor 172 [Frankliniella occidentalis]XP_052130168.1 TATA-binding protein-associated factor 172 [Frankliniella occidentalis]